MVNRHPLYNSTPNMQVPLLQKVFLFSGTSTNRHVPDVDTCHKGTLCYDPGYIQTLHLGGHFFWSQGYLLTGGCTVHFDQLWFILLWKTATFEEQEWRERFRSTINHHSRKRCSLFPSLTVIFKFHIPSNEGFPFHTTHWDVYVKKKIVASSLRGALPPINALPWASKIK